MKSLILQRNFQDDQGTFGTLVLGEWVFKTGENPWRANEQFYSCIPAGNYECIWQFSPKFDKPTYLLLGVKDRSEIRIHAGNFCGDLRKGYHSDVRGCILLGRFIREVNEQRALLKTKESVSWFETLLQREPFMLDVRDAPPVQLKLV